MIVAGAWIGLLSLSASAGDGPKRKRFWFRPKKDAAVIVVRTLAFMDQDKDGAVSSAEFYQHVKTYAFKSLDANKDGQISKLEWQAVETGPEAEALFQRWDRNGDGHLTLKEFRNTPKAQETIVNLFKTLDVDGDGELRASELNVGQEESK
jgi:Ca2+-binding EF-hand superfamily protein